MRRKMPFSASFGLEVNTVQSSGYIKNLVDKSALSTTKPRDLWVWSANHWVKAGKRALKGWQTVQGLSGRHKSGTTRSVRDSTCRETQAQKAGEDLVGKGSTELAAAGHTWLGLRLQCQPLAAALWLLSWRARVRGSPHPPVNSEVFNQLSTPPQQSLERHRHF